MKTPMLSRPAILFRAILSALVLLVAAALGFAPAASAQSWSDATAGDLGDPATTLGVSWADHDGDGDPDLYLSNLGAANRLLQNDGAGNFVDVAGPPENVGTGTAASAWGDYDNDGDLDVYLSTIPNYLLRNDGGSFTDVTTAVLADFGAGTSRGVVWVDYDNDGDLDLYKCDFDGVNNLFRNDGGGVFTDATPAPLALGNNTLVSSWGDYDNDGDQDVYISRTNLANLLLRNDGAGVFTDVTAGNLGDASSSSGGSWGDYDNDGDLDLFTASSTTSRLFRNDGADTFTDVTPAGLGGNSSGSLWGDFDLDGDLDLYRPRWGANSLHRNDGGGVFTDISASPINNADLVQGAALADIDGDGDLDIYIANQASANRLFRNEQVTGNSWLHVRTIGTSSNRSGIGAHLRAVTGGLSQLRAVESGTGLNSQGSLPVEFGLGAASAVDTLEIRWPSGIVQILTNVSVNQALDVVEPLFSDATPPVLADTGQGRAAAWGDHDQDGDPDLYLTNWGGNRHYRNDGGGVFSDITAGPLGDLGQSQGAGWADYDNDGDLDLYLANGGGEPSLLLRNDAGSFTDVTAGDLVIASSPTFINWIDFDQDGRLDLFVSFFNNPNRLFRNDGGDVFTDVTPVVLANAGSGSGPAWGDYDDDGDLDLYFPNDGATNFLFRNDGGGDFTDVTIAPLDLIGASRGAAWGDYDDDGDLDLYACDYAGPNTLFRNDGGAFTPVTAGPLGDSSPSHQASWGDFDNDGDLDLYVSNDGLPNRMFANAGGSFVDVTDSFTGDSGSGQGFGWADHDGDGDLDLYLVNWNGANKLLRNDAANQNNYLHVNLEGTVSNRDAVGARVRAVVGGRAQVRELSATSGYLSQNSHTVEFGLGALNMVDTLEIRWPSGQVDVYTDVEGNSTEWFTESLPADSDSDGDGLDDVADACPLEAPAPGEVDRDYDGCPDETSSFRFVKFWAEDLLPVSFETDGAGDPRIGDGSDFAALEAAFQEWAGVADVTLAGGDDGQRAGPSIAVAGDRRNSITFSDPAGFIPGILAITPTAVATGDTVIGGRAFRAGEIVDADMLFNTAQFSFSTPGFAGDPGAFDLRALATHEFGHFFGMAHSCVVSSVMFYVVPADQSAQTLAEDDIALARRGYAAAAPALAVEGRVLREDGLTPIPGAVVYAIAEATGDTLQMTLSGMDGTYRFFDVAETYRIRIQPLDGGPDVHGLVPAAVNGDLAAVVETDFVGEYWDLGDANDDEGSPGTLLDPLGGPTLGADVVINPDLDGPVVLQTTPADGESAAPAVGVITIRFDEAIDLASVAGPPAGLSLLNLSAETGVAGGAALLQNGRLLVFTPLDALAYGDDYELVVGSTVTDPFGNQVGAPVSVNFTVEPQPAVSLTSTSPGEVPIGAPLVLDGTGFDPVPANNSVNFPGGVVATPYASTLDKLYLTVPAGATTGSLNVVVGAQTSNSIPVVIAVPKAPATGNHLAEAGLGSDPRRLALSPDGAYAYVATAAGVSAVDADPASGAFLTATSIAVPGGCEDVLVLPDGARALAAASLGAELHVLDTNPASGTFHSILSTVTLADLPLGLAVVPGGSEVLIAFTDRVVLIAADEGPLFGQELRQWVAPGAGFRGELSVSPAGGEAYAATTDGKIAVLGLGAGEGVVALLTAGPSPREMAPLPDATGFAGVDADGTVRTFGTRGPLQDTLPGSGGYSGVVVPPAGGCAYAANFTLNRVDIVGLAGTPAVLESFATGVDPQDLALGGAGRYVYVITGAQDLLEVYDTGAGPLVAAVSPGSGGAGTLLTVSGSGFDPVATNNVVEIAGAAYAPAYADPGGTALVVPVPSGAASGPVQVISGGEASNSLSFKSVNRPDPGNFAFAPNFTTGGPGPVKLLESPTGNLLFALHGDGTLTVNSADPADGAFLRSVQVLGPGLTGLGGAGELAATPDGRKLFVSDPASGELAVFEVNENLAAPVARTGSVMSGAATLILGLAEGLAVTPEGSRVLAGSVSDQGVYEIDARADSVLAFVGGLGASPLPLAVHPNGLTAYAGDNPGGGPRVQVIDLDPASPTYRTVTQIIPVPNGLGGPHQLATSPDGTTLLALVNRPVAVSNVYSTEVIDIDPISPNVHTVVGTRDVALDVLPILQPNHSGTVLYVLSPNGPSVEAFDLVTLNPFASGPVSTQFAGSSSLAISRDDARLYVPRFGDGIQALDLSGATGLLAVSGLDQIGVAGTPLPAPLVFRVTGPDPSLAEGGFAVYQASPTSGDFGFPDRFEFSAADEGGLVKAVYTPSPAAGVDTVSVSSAAGVLSFEVTVLADTTLAPPQILAVAPDAGDPAPGVTTPIAVDFSKGIDPASVSGATFALRPVGGSGSLPGVYSFASRQRRVVFKPDAPLDPAADYEFELTAGLLDYNGNPLANPGTHLFSTAATFPLQIHAVDAPSGRTGVPVVVSGHSFGTNLAENTVLFGDVPAVPLDGDPGALLVRVPLGAQSGPLRVVVGADTTNSLGFLVLPPPAAPVNQTVAEVAVPASGQQIAVVPDGSRAYMTAPGANAVVPLVLAGQVSEPAVAVGLHPYGVAASPNGDRIYVSNFFSGDVSVIDGDSTHATFQQVIATVPTGLNPAGIAAHPDGRLLYVANFGDSTLTVVDTDTTSAAVYSARATVPTGKTTQTIALTPDGARVLVGVNDGLLIFNAYDMSARSTVPTGKTTQTVAVTPDGGLAVVLTTDGVLILIDILPGSPTEGQARATVPTGKSTPSIAVSPDGAFVYVSTADGTVDVFQIVQTGGSAAVPGAEACCSGISLEFVTSIEVGENPTGLAFDPSGSGLLLVINSGSETVSIINSGPDFVTITPWMDFTPNTLNLKSNGKYVTVYLEFAQSLDPNLLNLSSVRLAGALSPVEGKSGIGDVNDNGIPDWAVKFSRPEVFEVIPEGQFVPVTVEGWIDGQPFAATDTVRVLRPKVVSPRAGDIVPAGDEVEIRWLPMPDGAADHVDIFYSINDGADWDTVVVGTPDDSLHVWFTPELESPDCLLLVVAVDRKGNVTGIGGLDETFTMSPATDAGRTLPARFVVLPASPNPFLSSTRIEFELPEPADVSAEIFGIDGSLVRTLAREKGFPAGRHALGWDGTDEGGRRASSGVYFLRVVAGRERAFHKLVRMR